jgi:hypothetical protein
MDPRPSPAQRSVALLLAALAALVTFSCARRLARGGARRGAPPPVVAGGGAPLRAAPPAPAAREVGGPRMPHEEHLAKGLECVDCHEAGEDGNPTRPTWETCAECHDEEDAKLPEERRVKARFFGADGVPLWERAIAKYDPEVRWSHAPHGKLECTKCHTTLRALPRLAKPAFDMAACMACHEASKAPNACATCHAVLRGDVRPPSHAQAGWMRAHGPAAMGGERCETCHTDPATCDRCHQTTRPASHAAGWDRAHGAAALARSERCEMCHVDPERCSECHRTTRPASHDRLWHERHGGVALSIRGRETGRCDLCHSDPNFCQRCHAVEPPRNHTHLFRTRTHGVLAALDRSKCQVCHETDFCVRCHENTPPRSHGPLWASGPNLHCVQCHVPISFEGTCRGCHFEEPRHETAPDQPDWHTPGMNCRLCHTPAGNGAPPLRHLDNGMQCQACHH